LIADSNFLAKNNFMDYSLLVFIVIKPFSTVKPAHTDNNLLDERLYMLERMK
jgi:hypothetical protein